MWHALCTAHDTSGGRLPSGRGTSRAPACRRRSARSRGTLVVLAPGPLTLAVHKVRVYHASVLSPPLPYLRPLAIASTVRSNSRGNPPSLLPPSAPAPWPSPAPCAPVLPRPPLPPFPGPCVPGPLSPCLRLPFPSPAYTLRSNTRGIPPSLPSPFCPLVPWSLGKWQPRRTAPACGLFPSMSALPPPLLPALCPLRHYAGHCVEKSHACRRHGPGLLLVVS